MNYINFALVFNWRQENLFPELYIIGLNSYIVGGLKAILLFYQCLETDGDE